MSVKPLPYRLYLRAATLFAAGLVPAACTQAQVPSAGLHLDFGENTSQPGYTAVGATAAFSAERGYGWLDTSNLDNRDRQKPDDLRRDFVMGRAPRVFRINGLAPGRYLLKVVVGDTEYGDHVLQLRIPGAPALPVLSPDTAEFSTLATTVNTTGTLDITFDSPQNNWVVNSLTLEPAAAEVKPTVTLDAVPREPVASTWNPEVFKTDPTRPLLEQFRRNAATNPAGFVPTQLTRADYLKLIAREIDFWKQHQNENGAIIDPYIKGEVQYSTPAFAHAAAALVAWNNRKDLLEPAAKAMDWAVRSLSTRQAANSHEDFYPTMIAHAYVLLKPRVAPERAANWENQIRRFDPYKTYRMAMGSMNWNIVSSSGESLFQKVGLRDKNKQYVPDSLAAQGHHFASPYGLYLEGPMAYDHFPRIFLADIIAQGYEGPYSKVVAEALRRAAITSLFMQSPWGELPAGGRSAHHQWNEAEQALTYEIYGAAAHKAGDDMLAGTYKRAAHLALRSMFRWVRPSGEMQVVKNWVDPAQRHAYESYSSHSQYNLLPCSMLASAYDYASATEAIAERPAPADIGGYVLNIPELHKVFANAGGTYVELDTTADPHYDATGLIRIHTPGISPQLGPSDSLMAHPAYNSPKSSPTTTGIGVSWKDANGQWHTLGEMTQANIQKVAVKTVEASPSKTVFEVTYEGDLSGAKRIIEQYAVTPGRVELTTTISDYAGPLRYTWPVLADDGRVATTIDTTGNKVSVSQDGGKTAQTFTAPGAETVQLGPERYSNHNGWARLAVAEFPRGGKITLVIEPRSK